jgi:hypothetical protein
MSLLDMSVPPSNIDESTTDNMDNSGDTGNIDNISSNSEVKYDFLKPKFKTIEDQARAYIPLEKMMGSFTGAPDMYTPDNPILAEDNTYQEMSLVAKELNMSNEAFNKIASKYLEITSKNNEEFDKQNAQSQQAEINKLGEDGSKIIASVNTWLTNNFEEQDILQAKQLATTADGVKLLAKMKDLATKTAFNNQPKVGESIDYVPDIKKQLADAVTSERYRNDTKFAEHINQKYMEVYGGK